MRFVFLFVLLLCGCSPVNIEPAKQMVGLFHNLYQSGKYSEIYSLTSDEFQNATSKKKFIDIMNEARTEHLGDYKKSNLKFEKISHGFISNDEVSLIYYSEYSKRIVQEIFLLEVEGVDVKLKGYRYDSIN